jgi:ABC-type uncharacterized transport system substrate-binding protein
MEAQRRRGRLPGSLRLRQSQRCIASGSSPLPEPIFGAIVRALARHGYVPDRNVVLELRASGDRCEQLPQLAKDLVASNVDVILTFSCPAAIAAKNATTTIPIVATESGGDPVATGLHCDQGIHVRI